MTATVQLSNGRFLVIGDGTNIRPIAIGSHPAPDAADVSHHWRMWSRKTASGSIQGSLDYVRGSAATYATQKGADGAAERVRARVAAAAIRRDEIARMMVV